MMSKEKSKDKIKPGKDCIGVGCGVWLVNDQGETLLSMRASASKNEVGVWNKIGGALEFGETAIEALRREVLEEIGVEIDGIEFLSFTDHILPEESQHWVGLNYLGRIVDGQIPKNMEPHKNSELKWFKFDEIPENLAMPTKESLPLMISRYQSIFGK